MDSLTWDDTTWDGLTALSISERDPHARDPLLCGKHRRLSDKRIEACRKAKRSIVYHRNFKKNQIPGSCICDYTEFPKLLDERLSCRDKKGSTPYGDTSGLLTLPAELRLQIYEDVLVAPESIEFCPEPWMWSGHAPSGRDNQNKFDDEWDPIDEHYRQKIASFCSRAKLLRVNKQIHAEATAIFYQGNHFAFSNTSGWMGLLLFMYTIGMEKCRLLRHITVRHPLLTLMPISLRSDEHFRRSVIALSFPAPHQSWGFLSARWFDCEKAKAKKDVTRVLEKITGLRELNIVVDWPGHVPFFGHYPVDNEGFTRTLAAPLVDESKLKNLSVTLLGLVEKGWKVDDLASRAVELHNQTWQNENWDGGHEHPIDRNYDWVDENWDGVVRGNKWKAGEAVWENMVATKTVEETAWVR